MVKIYFLLFFCLILTSCKNNFSEDIAASAHGENLFLSDIIKEIPLNTIDSSFFIKNFINDWVSKKILLHHAKINLKMDQDEYDKKINEYKNSLIIYNYERQLVNQNLDTVITFDQIQNYYTNNIENFVLSQNIFKGRFIVVNKKAPKIELIKKIYKSVIEEDKIVLEDYCKQFAINYSISDTVWQYFSSLSNIFLNTGDNYVNYSLINKSNIIETVDNIYFIFINDFKSKGDVSPLSLETVKIRNVLLNKKKINYLEKLSHDFYNNSLALDKIKIYYK
tara:strand:+ start:3953 stop:4789 length:837 start_codon:yes stop_codon:yes gene_type:complete